MNNIPISAQIAVRLLRSELSKRAGVLMVHRAFAIEERHKMTVRWDANGYIIHCEFPYFPPGG